MRHNLMRRFSSNFAMAVMYALTALALVPLGLVLWFTIAKGLPAVTNLEFFINSQRPSGIPGSGIANAIVGSAIIVDLASAAAIPVGVLGGVYLAEYDSGRWASWERLAVWSPPFFPLLQLRPFWYAFAFRPPYLHS